jgi:hypothetical protein
MARESVRIAGTVDIVLIKQYPIKTPSAIKVRDYVQGIGNCEWYNLASYNIPPGLSCFSTWPRTFLHVEANRNQIWSFGASETSYSNLTDSSDIYAPWPLHLGYMPGKDCDFRPPSWGGSSLGELPRLIAARPVAYLRRSFEFDNLNPCEHYVRTSGQNSGGLWLLRGECAE